MVGGYTFSKVHDLLVLHDECARAGIIVAVSDEVICRHFLILRFVLVTGMTQSWMRHVRQSRLPGLCAIFFSTEVDGTQPLTVVWVNHLSRTTTRSNTVPD